MNSQSEDHLRSAIRGLATSSVGGISPDLSLVKKAARRRLRTATAGAAACAVAATIGVAAIVQAGEPTPSAPVANGSTQTESPANLPCGRERNPDYATTQDLDANPSTVTVCQWRHSDSDDPETESTVTLEAEHHLTKNQTAALMDALRSAELSDPSCAIIDSFPELSYDILIPTDAGVRAVPVNGTECLGFAFADDQSTRLSGAIIDEIQKLTD